MLMGVHVTAVAKTCTFTITKNTITEMEKDRILLIGQENFFEKYNLSNKEI